MDEEIKNLLKAILAVLVEGRSEEAKNVTKDEILLHESGIDARDIALMLNKNYGAVIKSIQRAKKGK